MDGEERERADLEAQIARAKAQAEAKEEEQAAGLQKKEGEKVTLSLMPATPQASAATPAGPASDQEKKESSEPTESKTASTTASAESASAKPVISFGAFGGNGATPAPAPLSISNPLKRPAPVNVFKQAKTPKTDSDAASTVGGGKKGFVSEAERLMKEDLARKAARNGGGGYQGAGPRRAEGPRRSVF